MTDDKQTQQNKQQTARLIVEGLNNKQEQQKDNKQGFGWSVVADDNNSDRTNNVNNST